MVVIHIAEMTQIKRKQSLSLVELACVSLQYIIKCTIDIAHHDQGSSLMAHAVFDIHTAKMRVSDLSLNVHAVFQDLQTSRSQIQASWHQYPNNTAARTTSY